MFSKILAAALTLAAATPALSQDDPFAVDANPYVQLYARRVDVAKVQVEKQEAQVRFDTDQLTMTQYLADRNAASKEELRRAQLALALSQAALRESKFLVGEAEATLQIARVRIGGGQDMPICLK
ncbi:MAG: hypothetical protein IT520_07520 [Burkholderiales bacterium]|nr:hypothetical protein [Burkholderiales bacterium]